LFFSLMVCDIHRIYRVPPYAMSTGIDVDRNDLSRGEQGERTANRVVAGGPLPAMSNWNVRISKTLSLTRVPRDL
jgi:hypothetical protein